MTDRYKQIEQETIRRLKEQLRDIKERKEQLNKFDESLRNRGQNVAVLEPPN